MSAFSAFIRPFTVAIPESEIDDLKQRNLVFAYADDAAWLRQGRSFACDGRSAAQILAMGRGASPAAGQHQGIAAI